MPSNNTPQSPTNYNSNNPFYFNIHDGDQYKVPTDFEAIRRDHPDEYEFQVKTINFLANTYVNSYNTLPPERQKRLYSIAEDPKRKGSFPPIILERFAAHRAMLSSTPAKYSFCPYRRIVCCCCPTTITGHVKYCCPVPVRDMESVQREHPTECTKCFADFLSFFVTYNNCTTDDERDALMAPYQEKLFSSQSLRGFFGDVFEESSTK